MWKQKEKVAGSEQSAEALKIAEQLRDRGSEWGHLLAHESIGGNAGDDRAGINTFVDKKTGKIIAFGNIQDIPEDVRNSPEYGQASFLYNYGDGFRALAERRESLVKPYFEEVTGRGITRQALENLREAIKIYNSKHQE